MNPDYRARRVEQLDKIVTPYEALEAFEGEYVCLLENPGDPTTLGRYSFLCAEPFYVFRSKRARTWGGPPGDLRELPGRPIDELDALLRRYRLPVPDAPAGAPPLLGGAVGYLAYELLYEIEQIPDLGVDDQPVPDSYLGLYDVVIAYDGIKRKSWLIANGFGATEAEARERADRRFDETLARLKARPEPPAIDAVELRRRRAQIMQRRVRLSERDVGEAGVRCVSDGERYLQIIEKAKEHIFAGDTFEICTARRFDTTYTGSGLWLYRILRAVNPAPFAAFLRFPELEVMSSSPERFASLDRERWVETRPIKGTRPRGRTPEEDDAYRKDLATCEKDRAENVMIVDLARNDLGRVCTFNTVVVPELAAVESYPFTFQLVSTVRGRLRDELGPVDLLRAAYPGGSMTGAPKVEAMKIIDALEPVKRGVFAGSVGYLDFDGSIDLSIVIRTFVKTGDKLTFHTGGAIVADSSPAEELQETLDKAHGMITSLELAREKDADQ